jgi:hypothetical protein
MPKEIRYGELVKKCGKPEVVTLWTSAKDNPTFMKAVRENRVLTVFQKPTGTQKDFGFIGFHQDQFAVYLVFPRKLPKLSDARVIGIKYESMEPQPAASTASKIVKTPRVAAPKIPNPIKTFRVLIQRTATQEVEMKVRASSLQKAEEKALQEIKTTSFKSKDIQSEIKSVEELSVKAR